MVVEEVYLNIIAHAFMHISFSSPRNKLAKEGILAHSSVSFLDLKVVFALVFKIISHHQPAPYSHILH